ncbi:MAG: lactate racemase domain-containing protein [Candidatus Firestonebacteria bacterium]
MTTFSNNELINLCKEGLSNKKFNNKKVLVIIPDTTRSGPIDLFFKSISQTLLPVVSKLDFLIALGTHLPISKGKICKHLGINMKQMREEYKNVKIFQHHWDKKEELQYVGSITKKEMSKISNGLLKEDIPVTINKRIFGYDELILVGPVFPHEVVGFSGGYKYLFPGISGPEFLHKFHWLGALITNPKINGTKNTPVREAINKAISFIKIPKTLFCYVVGENKKVYGIYIGNENAWSKAADLSAQINIKYVPKSFHTVLSMAPLMYEDIWTAGKCMYKLEPVVADNGTLIIYAPHIKEISHTHGEYIKKVGYHTRDYFLKQMDKFKNVPGCTLAHSTHVKGIGTYENGIEKPRVNVVLATKISEEVCKKVNLGYMNYRHIKLKDYINKEDKGILVVKDAGEVLFRLKSGKVPDIDKLYEKN